MPRCPIDGVVESVSRFEFIVDKRKWWLLGLVGRGRVVWSRGRVAG